MKPPRRSRSAIGHEPGNQRPSNNCMPCSRTSGTGWGPLKYPDAHPDWEQEHWVAQLQPPPPPYSGTRALSAFGNHRHCHRHTDTLDLESSRELEREAREPLRFLTSAGSMESVRPACEERMTGRPTRLDERRDPPPPR